MAAAPSPTYLAAHDALSGALLVAARRGGTQRPRNFETILRLCPPLTEPFITERDMFLAASELRELGLIEVYGSDGSETDLSEGDDVAQLMITAHGMAEFRRPATHAGKAAKDFVELDDDEIAAELEDVFQDLDVLDPIRYRRPEELIDIRGTPELKRLEERLDRVIALVTGSNQVAAAASPETAAALERVKQGTTLVRTGQFSLPKVEVLLFGALAYLATKFIDAPIGEAAQAAWTALKTATAAFIGL